MIRISSSASLGEHMVMVLHGATIGMTLPIGDKDKASA